MLLPLSYARAIHGAGGMVAMLPPDRRATEDPDELLDISTRWSWEAAPTSTRRATARKPTRRPSGPIPIGTASRSRWPGGGLSAGMPLLSICRGMQILNVACGGTLDQHLPGRLGHERHRPLPGSWAEHEVRIEPGSLAATAAGTEHLTVKSHRHQGVETRSPDNFSRESLGDRRRQRRGDRIKAMASSCSGSSGIRRRTRRTWSFAVWSHKQGPWAIDHRARPELHEGPIMRNPAPALGSAWTRRPLAGFSARAAGSRISPEACSRSQATSSALKPSPFVVPAATIRSNLSWLHQQAQRVTPRYARARSENKPALPEWSTRCSIASRRGSAASACFLSGVSS